MPTLTGTDTTIRVEPLKQWPEGYERRENEERTGAPFDTALRNTIKDLDHELRMIEAGAVVLQVDVSGDEIRKRDGLPYKRAEVDPGVVLTFENEEGTQTYPADKYEEWADNLRAIYYTLHDLRRITRHGVGHGSEQYRGFTALPGAGQTTTTMTAREAAIELASMTPLDPDDLLENPKAVARAFRTKAKWAHPDHGGDEQGWLQVQDARKVLTAHHGQPA